MLKCFTQEQTTSWFGTKTVAKHEEVEITALNFGPYDNGHVIVGFNTGYILVLNSFDLSSMFRLKVFEDSMPVTNIVFDPT